MSALGTFGRAIAMADSANRSYGLRGVWTLLYAHFTAPFFPRVRKVDLGSGALFLRRGTSDNFVFKDIFMNRTYDLTKFRHFPRVEAFYADTVARGLVPLIIDCGAYSGLSTRFFAEQFPLADIIAIEPSENNFNLLKKNTAAFGRLFPRRAAISEDNSTVRIENPDGALCGFITARCDPADVDAIESVSLNTLIRRDPKTVPFIVKLDIEGAERVACEDNDWFSRSAIVIIELHDWMFPWEGSSAPLLRTLASNEVDVVISGENLIVFNWSVLCAALGHRPISSEEVFV